jgi:hypothetical protein
MRQAMSPEPTDRIINGVRSLLDGLMSRDMALMLLSLVLLMVLGMQITIFGVMANNGMINAEDVQTLNNVYEYLGLFFIPIFGGVLVRIVRPLFRDLGGESE